MPLPASTSIPIEAVMSVILPWALVVFFAVLALYFAFRKERNPYPESVQRLLTEVEEGEELAASAAEDPPEVTSLRLALGRGWAPIRSEVADPTGVAVRGLVRYLLAAVVPPLRRGGGNDVEDALNAVEDLVFYAGRHQDEDTRVENLAQLIQGVTREYALETGVAIRYRGPSGTLPVRVRAEALKDALFLILANAGRFGEGKTVDVQADVEDDRIRVRIRDRGVGFSREALDRAFEPFWTTDADALGLGLTHARTLVEGEGGRMKVGNVEEGGGEVVITLPKAH